MNFATTLQLLGINPVLTDAQAREVKDALSREAELVSHLDAEIAEAVAQLASLKQRRNDIERQFHLGLGPSEQESAQLVKLIQEKEAELAAYDNEIEQTHLALSSLLQLRETETDDTIMSRPEDTAGPSRSLSQLESEIMAHQDKLTRLTAERDKTIAALEHQQCALSPIRRIPLEVLGEIFLQSLPSDPYIAPSPRSSPLLLSQICRSWRALSCSIPRLWSSIKIELSKDICRPHPLTVQTWVKRSMMHPLSFHIFEDIKHEDIVTDDLTLTTANILDALIPSYNRWRSVRLDFTDWRVETGLSKIPKNAVAPTLETLSVTRDFWLKEDDSLLQTLLSAPNLSNLTWTCRHSHLNPTTVVSLSQMTHIHLDTYMPVDEFQSVLSQCHALKSCHFYVLHETITNPSHKDADEGDRTPTLVHHLEDMDLSIIGTTHDIFTRFAFPSLKTIKVTKAVEFFAAATLPSPPFWYHNQFMGMLARSGCILDSIELCSADVGPSEMLSLLKASPMLTNLTLADEAFVEASKFVCVNDDVLRALTVVQEEDGHICCVCPQLLHLKLWGCVQATDGVLSSMIESRWLKVDYPHARQLKMALLMLRPEDMYKQDISQLQALGRLRTGLTLL